MTMGVGTVAWFYPGHSITQHDSLGTVAWFYPSHSITQHDSLACYQILTAQDNQCITKHKQNKTIIIQLKNNILDEYKVL